MSFQHFPLIIQSKHSKEYHIPLTTKTFLNQIEGPLRITAMMGSKELNLHEILDCVLGNNMKEENQTEEISIEEPHDGPIDTSKDPISSVSDEEELTLFSLYASSSHPEHVYVVQNHDSNVEKEKENHQSQSKLFTLAVLIASSLVYQLPGEITKDTWKELKFLEHLPQSLRIKGTDDPETMGDKLGSFMPKFIWLGREFKTKWLTIGDQKCTSKEYLENALTLESGFDEATSIRNAIRMWLIHYFPSRDCITVPQKFHLQREKLEKGIINDIPVKVIMDHEICGSMLTEVIELYLNDLNKDEIPVIKKASDLIVERKCSTAVRNVLKEYKESLIQSLHGGFFIEEKDNNEESEEDEKKKKQTSPINVHKFFEIHWCALQKAKESFLRIDVGASYHEKILQTMNSVEEKIEEIYEKYQEKNKEFFEQEYIKEKEKLHFYTTFQSQEESIIKSSRQEFAEKVQNIYLERSIELESMIGRYKEKQVSEVSGKVLCISMIQILQAFLSFGYSTVKQFQKHIETAQEELHELNISVSVAESSESSVSSSVSDQKRLYDEELTELSDQLANERKRLREQMEEKRSELQRTMQQMEEMKIIHQQEINRQHRQLEATRQKANDLTEQAEEVKSVLVKNVKEVGRELIETERGFHREEKNLWQNQTSQLSQIATFEQELVTIQTDHIQTILKTEQEIQEKEDEEEKKMSDEIKQLKQRAKEDIGTLRTVHEKRVRQLRKNIDHVAESIQAVERELMEMEAKEAADAEKNGEICKTS